MATLVLAVGAAALSSGLGLTAAAAAGSIAASIGIAAIGAVATIVGGIIDSYLFAPHYTQEGPRLNELQIQSSTEGQPIPELWGKMRTAGQLIWATRFKEVVTKETEKVGGKGGVGGGGKVTTTTYDYYMSMAFGVVRRATSWGRIWADGKLAYREAQSSNETTTSSSVSFQGDTLLGGAKNFITLPAADFNEDIPSVDIKAKIAITGSASNNGTFTVAEVKDYEGNKKQILVEEVLTTEAAGASVTIDVTELPKLDELNNPVFYNGGASQAVDSIIEAIQGNGNTSAYKQCAYARFYDVHLERFGNRIPSLVFELEYEP